ncbi:hypothetical protein SCP_0310930 [Sparassis crispa]|uniref:Uncharacterized protein n=1 Tax=Sparassis crispa TaxID=139825 RepID=A0A401GGP7_9APHY|nr:hypothetical protein SCP_0310930 [Sparassis crispa]GBE81366.1 hypothetical protein SCP_0310930 [Sparassis crispa]
MLFQHIIPLAFATTVFSTPALLGRQTNYPCDGLGSAALETAYDFTLAIYNVTNGAVSSSGAPAALTVVTFSEEDNNGAVVETNGGLTTYASYPNTIFPGFSLINGTLIPSGLNGVTASDFWVYAGSVVLFGWSEQPDLVEPGAPIYCAVPNAVSEVPYPVLAVNADPSSFSMCLTTDSGAEYYNIVYSAEGGSKYYNYDTCYPVTVVLQGLSES